MLSVTREKESGRILVTTSGVLDEAAVQALLRAVELAPDQAHLVIDFSQAEIRAPGSLQQLACGLAQRSGVVSFRGPAFGQTFRSPAPDPSSR